MHGLAIEILKSETFNYYEIKSLMIYQFDKNLLFKNMKKGESISYISNNKEEHYFVDSLDKIKEKVVYFLNKNVPYQNDCCSYFLDTNVLYYFPDLQDLVNKKY